jgi:hypothetical protein
MGSDASLVMHVTPGEVPIFVCCKPAMGATLAAAELSGLGAV